jgi:2-oxoglutarate dehydrogenase E2 component (dihydrolipoamide succinyltransferase)
MTIVEMIMPKMGESIMEGTILNWLKKEGDSVEQDESVLEVATDKVDTEVPSLYSGKLKEILANEGEVVQVGKPIALLEIEGDVKVTASEEITPVKQETVLASPSTLTERVATAVSTPMKSSVGKFYSPLVLNIARRENVTIEELDDLTGTGQEGRVTKKDIISYVKSKNNGGVSEPVQYDFDQKPKASAPKPALVVNESDEIIEMDRMRKMIAQRMLDSVQTSPHVTSFVEADVSEVVAWRGASKRKLMEEEGQALTYTPIFIEAVVKAIKDYPMINIQVDGDRIIKKGNINIGMAVALPSGNLIVPVIHDADKLSLRELAVSVNELARKARSNELKADDLSGGTYTISNVGSFGNVMGTPILVQPQVGILALGAIVKKPAVVESASGDMIAVRHKMFLSHSYDHRVVDGALGGMFVRRVADYLEKFDVGREI